MRNHPEACDARKEFPSPEIILETEEGKAYHQKTDIFKRIYWYSSDKNMAANLTAVPVERVKEIIELNKKGKKPEKLLEHEEEIQDKNLEFTNTVGEDSLNRFDNKAKKPKQFKKKKKKSRKNFKNRRDENKS